MAITKLNSLGITTTNPISFSAGTAALPSITFSGDTNTGVFAPTADTIAFTEGGTESLRIDSSANLQFNSGYGSVATAYGCRAWVNFNGTGTVAIRSSGNVTSITDNGTGDYTVNFTTAMTDVNYSAQYTTSQVPQIENQAKLATGSVRVTSLSRSDSFSLFDTDMNSVAIFR